jgi:hypothetical protein
MSSRAECFAIRAVRHDLTIATPVQWRKGRSSRVAAICVPAYKIQDWPAKQMRERGYGSWVHKKEGKILLHHKQQMFLKAFEEFTSEQKQNRARIASHLPALESACKLKKA